MEREIQSRTQTNAQGPVATAEDVMGQLGEMDLEKAILGLSNLNLSPR